MRTTRTMPSLTGLVPLSALALLAGCGGDTGDEELEPFHFQEIAFAPCDPPEPPPGAPAPPDLGYQCGTLRVPLDYADPEGATAEIAMLRVPATGGEPSGSIMLNPGGPGFPGTDYAVMLGQVWADTRITEEFDLIGFDPRGVGRSTPAVDCYTDAEREDDAPLSSFDGGPQVWTEEDTEALRAQCVEGSGGAAALDHLGTRDVARDLDVMRAALGDEELTFVGASYGTRLGAVYAEMFPERVRALVLDGAMDPALTSHERRVQQYTGLQGAFEEMAAVCAQDPECPLGTDPAAATAEFQSLVRPLIEEPVPAGEGRELTFTKAVGGVVSGMYSEQAWPAVVQGIEELRSGRGDTLLALSDGYQGRGPDGVYTDHLEATFAINCLDEDRHDPQGGAELKRAVHEVAPFLDPGLPVEDVWDGCAQWPGDPTLGWPLDEPIEGLADTLTVSVTGDALTPHEGGINLAQVLGGSLLTVEGNQHGALLADNDCIRDAVTAYLVDLESPDAGATCSL